MWTEVDILTASNGATDDRFGNSVFISGDYAIVGAFGDDMDKGSAYIFERIGGSWTEIDILTAGDGAAGDHFGGAVSISGDYAIVGAYGNDDNGAETGSAYIFERTGSSWTQVAKLLAGDGAANDYFGGSVSISGDGDYAIVAAHFDDNDNGPGSGSVYIFKRTGSSWTEIDILTASDGAANDYFGGSVSMSGEYAIVGAQYDDDKGTDSGSAYV